MTMLSPERQAQLDQQMDELRNLWRIGDECGEECRYSDAEKLCSTLQVELRFYAPADKYTDAMGLLSLVKSWRETGNPHFIDAAVLLCHQLGVSPPPTLNTEIVDVAAKRYAGIKMRGTAAQVRTTLDKQIALDLVSRFRAAGLSRNDANAKVAMILHLRRSENAFKASSLEQFYDETWRSIESERRLVYSHPHSAEALSAIKELVDNIPEAPDEVVGSPKRIGGMK